MAPRQWPAHRETPDSGIRLSASTALSATYGITAIGLGPVEGAVGPAYQALLGVAADKDDNQYLCQRFSIRIHNS